MWKLCISETSWELKSDRYLVSVPDVAEGFFYENVRKWWFLLAWMITLGKPQYRCQKRGRDFATKILLYADRDKCRSSDFHPAIVANFLSEARAKKMWVKKNTNSDFLMRNARWGRIESPVFSGAYRESGRCLLFGADTFPIPIIGLTKNPFSDRTFSKQVFSPLKERGNEEKNFRNKISKINIFRIPIERPKRFSPKQIRCDPVLQ